MDTQPNGSQAAPESIMQDIGGAVENIHSYKRVAATSGRFRILKDKYIMLDPTNSQTDGTNTASIGFTRRRFSFQYSPRSPIQVNLASGNATPNVAGLQSCNIFMVCAGCNGAGAV